MSLRIAWAGPWNEQSAIAAFGLDVVRALMAAGHTVAVFRTEALEGAALAPLPAPCPVHPPGILTPELLSGGFDAVFVNLGNYYAFHGGVLAILRASSAILIAHDCVMDGFCHGWAASGPAADPGYAPLLATSGSQGDTLLAQLAALAIGAVVHGPHYKAQVEAACPGPVVALPLGMAFQAICDGLPPPYIDEKFVVATIGHVNVNKRVDQVIRAIGASPLLRARAHYMVVGPVEEWYRDRLIAIARRVEAPMPQFTGPVSDETLRMLLGGVAAICCLREPITEGGSASLILALRSGRPTLVCDHGSYGELPDDTVLKCPPGREAAHVLYYLEMLMEQPALGRSMATRARAYAAKVFAPEAYGTAIVHLAGQVARLSPRLLARRRITDSLRSLNLPCHASAVQKAMHGLSTLLGDEEEGTGMPPESTKTLKVERGSAEALIPVYRPDLSGNERAYVLECVDTSWISSIGVFIERFERAVADFTGARHAVAVCNGTVALHLALHCLDLGPGDEVIVPSFTYIASVNTIAQTGARPVFAESRREDWLLDPDDVARRITARTKAILPVHLYGVPCDMAALQAIADRHGIAVVEDCAEALGTTIEGRHVGRWSRAATFSFFGNKTVTTGEGGMVITDDDALARRLRQVKGQGQSFTRRYWHEVFGLNYRMTNIAAAIGTAQMERIGPILHRKREIVAQYRSRLAHLPVTFQQVGPGIESSGWLVSLLLPPEVDRGRVMEHMAANLVETRPVFFPAHRMPMYESTEALPIAEEIARRGMSLPSYPGLAENDITRVTDALAAALQDQAR